MPVYICISYLKQPKNNFKEDVPNSNMFIFLPAALLELVATVMSYVGLQYTRVSQFTMLRGSLIIFVGLLSVIFLNKKLEWFRWAGMAVVVIGTVMVGAADFFKDSEEDGLSNAIIGDIIVVSATVCLLIFFCYIQTLRIWM